MKSAGIYLPLNVETDRPKDATFSAPSKEDLGDISTARLLYDSARLGLSKRRRTLPISG